MIETITSRGMLIHACSLPGETKAENVIPSLVNGSQLSRNRWLIVCDTRGFRGIDDDWSVFYQLREGTPDGRVLREGFLAKTTDGWDPLGDGRRYVKQCGHSVVFGVPKGALIRGRPAANANVFVAAWRVTPRGFNRERRLLLRESEAPTPPTAHRIEWVQFRLNEVEDDIEILQHAGPMRQKGYEDSVMPFCRHETLQNMNQTFVSPVPFNDDATEWVVVEHFDIQHLAAIKFVFNARSGLYEWVETGPLLNDPQEIKLFEASIARHGGRWVISARLRQHPDPGMAWFNTDDPFGPPTPVVVSNSIHTRIPNTVYACPITMYRGPDGVIRVFTTDVTLTPYKGMRLPPHVMNRCPLYMWDIDVEHGFAVSNCRVVFDSVAAGIPFEYENKHINHFCKLLPHSGGRTGYLAYLVRPDSLHYPNPYGMAAGLITPAEVEASGIYYSTVTYDGDYPPAWQF